MPPELSNQGAHLPGKVREFEKRVKKSGKFEKMAKVREKYN